MSFRQQQARVKMIQELRALQEQLTENWIGGSLPDDWNGLDSADPVAPAKTRVTIRLDNDMVRWFRKLGPGYSARINQILRIYWQAVLAGQVRAHWDEDTAGPRFAEYLDRKMAILREQREQEKEAEAEGDVW